MIYYYCKSTTFESIVKNHSLWLSDMTQSNDIYEIHRYISLVYDAIKAARDSIPKVAADKVPQRGPKLVDYEKNETRRKVYTRAMSALSKSEADYYCLAICFSDRGDNLSQWRGYGDDGFGISIGFNEDRIEELSQQHKLFKYEDVVYYSGPDDPTVKDKIQGYLDELDSISRDFENSQKGMAAVIDQWRNRIFDNDVPFLKPAGFIDERETRFCYVRFISPFEMASPKENSHLLSISSHVSNNAIVLHYVLPLNDSNNDLMKDIISEVTIGPCNGSSVNTIKCLLAKYGFDHHKIDVRKSEIPYRARR